MTEADYAEVTERRADVQRATLSLGQLAYGLRDRSIVKSAVVSGRVRRPTSAPMSERYRMAGHDVEVDGPQFVSLKSTCMSHCAA